MWIYQTLILGILILNCRIDLSFVCVIYFFENIYLKFAILINQYYIKAIFCYFQKLNSLLTIGWIKIVRFFLFLFFFLFYFIDFVIVYIAFQRTLEI